MSGAAAEVTTRRWGGVPEALDELTAGRATGALHVEGVVGGTIYLLDGEIYYVQTAAAPGVDCLLQASGTVPPSVFQTAWTAGAAAGQVGEVLVKSGALSRGEAELCTAAAITDGAFALFTASPAEMGPVRFAPGEGHWWGALRRVGAAALEVQIRKRRRLLERTPPGDADDQPVIAAARLGRHHVVLTDLQWELVVHADGRRTPRELARLLGRSAFTAVLETRRLMTAGLVRVATAPPLNLPPATPPGPPPGLPPGQAPPPPPPSPRPPAASTTPSLPPYAAALPADPEHPGARHASETPAPVPVLARRTPDGAPLPRRQPAHALPRRQPGAALRGVVPVGPQPDVPSGSVLDVPEPDSGLLSRVRNALEGLR
ncbi:DUF4388 domain-containing protein [Cryptosporangium sp. NPDC051539]|uniref:DUF4388 domain-containing protein n=1 Tax=Cryptosporangium sp. NPDC051539 TaxID=3363962 RepID=UPI00379143AA